MIKQSIHTMTFLQSVGVPVDRQGNALCPFHRDTNKSLKVYRDPARGWHCFGCHKGGSVIDMCMLWYGITFRQAVTRLDADFGLGLPLTQRQTAHTARLAREQAMKRQEEKKATEYALEAAETAYWAAFDKYLTIARLIDRYRPKRPSDEISAVYAWALHQLPIVRDEYERAQDVWITLKEGGTLYAAAG